MQAIRIFFLVFISAFAFAQSCPKYDAAIKKGDRAFMLKNYDTALIAYQVAQIAARECGIEHKEPAEGIDKVFKALKAEKNEAIEAKKEAEALRREAEKQNAIARRALSFYFKNDTDRAAWVFDFKSKKYAAINREGEILGKGFIWENPTEFSKSRSIASYSDFLWFVNDSGKIISQGYKFIKQTNFPSYYYADDSLIFPGKNRFEAAFEVSEYLSNFQHLIIFFPFKSNGKYGFINRDGLVRFDSKYDSLRFCYTTCMGDFVAAKKMNSWDLVDLDEGRIISSFSDFNELHIELRAKDSICESSEKASDKSNYITLKIDGANYIKNVITNELTGPYIGNLEPIDSGFFFRNAYIHKLTSDTDDVELVTNIINPKSGLVLPKEDFSNPVVGWDKSIISNSQIFGQTGYGGYQPYGNVSTGLLDTTTTAGKILNTNSAAMSNSIAIMQSQLQSYNQYLQVNNAVGLPNAGFYAMYRGIGGSLMPSYGMPGYSANEIINTNSKIDFTLCYDKNGVPLQFYSTGKNLLEISNRRLHINLTKKFIDSSQILAIDGLSINKRCDLHVENYFPLERSGVYSALGKKGLLKPDGSILTPPVFDVINYPHEYKYLAVKYGKYGFIDTSGWIIPCDYQYAADFHNGKACVKKNGKWGFINHKGETVISFKYDSLSALFSQNLCKAKINGKWGYIDSSERWMIKPAYEKAYDFDNGIAAVKENGKWGYLNLNGNIIHSLTFNEEGKQTSNCWGPMLMAGKWGGYNITTDKTISPVYDTLIPFSANSAWVRQDSIWHIINSLGEKTTCPNGIKNIVMLENGLAIAYFSIDEMVLIDSVGQQINKVYTGNFIYYGKGLVRYRLLDMQNKQVVLLPKGTIINGLELYSEKFDNCQLIKTGEGIINQDGELILKGSYAYNLIGYRILEINDGNKKGYAAFSNFGSTNDTIPKQIKLQRFLPPEYDEIGFPIDKEFMPVKKNGKWGFIKWQTEHDGTEKPILQIPCKYDAVVPFFKIGNEQVALVKENEHIFYIDEKDELIFSARVYNDHEDIE